MKNYLKVAILLCGMLLFNNCADDGTDPQGSTIGLHRQNEDVFAGKMAIQDTDIAYSATATGELTFDIDILLNEKEINGKVDYRSESISVDGHDYVVSEVEKEYLLEVGKHIAEYLLVTKDGDIELVEYSLLSLIEYWGKSPENYTYGKREVYSKDPQAVLKSRNEGITCIRKNTFVNAEYDDSRGNHVDNVAVGSKARENYGCMGRCGADCGRWWIPSAWTKDCLDHDQCSNVNNSSGGSSDANCGDEFDEALDDYVFGVIRGCRG
ncbi:hypothetical protein [Maribacter sp. 2-571]|uniref:hypothetical protein n=1 Tax=Maribacter sp. 2-571 TaxID=3417569 RepID=UPI003D34494B